ncbi:hypothetical protein PR048_031774 [Dryococelus australis]|uniref:Uncharacterized protein n=1 Tax=Dryococelus australis TaxID=614101 RepID=A0ABQ9G680_9NEOP|nr:hypothetical protein PR048_031774 [Dryococelus australis]
MSGGVPSDSRRAAREVTSGREICDCEYQAVKGAAGRLDYWTRCPQGARLPAWRPNCIPVCLESRRRRFCLAKISYNCGRKADVDVIDHDSNEAMRPEMTQKHQAEEIMKIISTRVQDLKMQEVKKEIPKVTIYNLEKKLTSEETYEEIYCQNSQVNITIEEYKSQAKIVYRTKDQHKNNNNIIMEVRPKNFHYMKLNNRLYTEQQSYKLNELISPARCFKCIRFCHVRKNCRSDLQYRTIYKKGQNIRFRTRIRNNSKIENDQSWSAILINKNIQVLYLYHVYTNKITVIMIQEFRSIYNISAYFQPSINITVGITKLQYVLNQISLRIINKQAEITTYDSIHGTSNIDISLVSNNIIENCKIIYYNLIIWVIHSTQQNTTHNVKITLKPFKNNFREHKQIEFQNKFDEQIRNIEYRNIEEKINVITETVKQFYKKVKIINNGQQQPKWRTTEISEKKKTMQAYHKTNYDKKWQDFVTHIIKKNIWVAETSHGLRLGTGAVLICSAVFCTGTLSLYRSEEAPLCRGLSDDVSLCHQLPVLGGQTEDGPVLAGFGNRCRRCPNRRKTSGTPDFRVIQPYVLKTDTEKFSSKLVEPIVFVIHISVALSIVVLRADKGVVKGVCSKAGMKGWGKRDTPRKPTDRPQSRRSVPLFTAHKLADALSQISAVVPRRSGIAQMSLKVARDVQRGASCDKFIGVCGGVLYDRPLASANVTNLTSSSRHLHTQKEHTAATCKCMLKCGVLHNLYTGDLMKAENYALLSSTPFTSAFPVRARVASTCGHLTVLGRSSKGATMARARGSRSRDQCGKPTPQAPRPSATRPGHKPPSPILSQNHSRDTRPQSPSHYTTLLVATDESLKISRPPGHRRMFARGLSSREWLQHWRK